MGVADVVGDALAEVVEDGPPRRAFEAEGLREAARIAEREVHPDEDAPALRDETQQDAAEEREGVLLLTPDVFDALEKTARDKGGEIQLTNGLRDLRQPRALFGYRFEGVRHDAGNKLGYLRATVEFALKREDLGGPFRDYLKTLKL